MILPVWRIDRGILDVITAVDHLSVSGIDSYVGYRITGVVCSCKENDVSCFCLRCADMLALVINALCCCPRQIIITAVGHHVADKSRAVKAR